MGVGKWEGQIGLPISHVKLYMIWKMELNRLFLIGYKVAQDHLQIYGIDHCYFCSHPKFHWIYLWSPIFLLIHL